VRDSVVDEFEDLYLEAMQKNGSYSLNRLADPAPAHLAGV